MANILLTDREVALQVAFKDENDNSTTIADPVVWSTSDPALVTLEPYPDDNTVAKITPVGPAGNVQVTATAGAVISTVDITLKLPTEPGAATTGEIFVRASRQPIVPGTMIKLTP